MRRIATGVAACFGIALMQMAAVAEENAKPPTASSGWSTEVAPERSTGATNLAASQVTLVKKVSDYFRSLSTLHGEFVQTSADNKRMRGKFYVKRPGRFRFDYALPSRQIVISDGRYLAVQDLDLNNEDRVALDQTPFRLLLQSDVNLIRDAKVTEVQESEDIIVLALEDKNPDAPGQIKLFLTTTPELQLKGWVTKDAEGLNTRVEISNLDKTAYLDGDLFKITAPGWAQ